LETLEDLFYFSSLEASIASLQGLETILPKYLPLEVLTSIASL